MRLLLAEDELELSEALRVILKHNHYSVDAVHDGMEALDYILSGQYDGVVLDIMMPKMDGLTVLRKVRESGNTVPILMLTARAQIEDRIQGLDQGADDYLVKPFAMGEFLARIRAITRRRTAYAPNLLQCGNITLSRETFLLAGPKGEYRLGNKEFQILELMMQSPNRVISSEQFLSRIWGYDAEAELSVVWVYISNLRKKLQILGSNIQIKAVRNQGYSLEDEE